QIGLSPEEPAISAILDKHFLKMEKLLTEFTEKMEKAPLKEIPQLEMNIVGKLKKVFTDLTEGLKQIVVDTKEQVRDGIENKVNDFKIDIHNKIASKVQGINDNIKKFADTLDAKYSIIEMTGKIEEIQGKEKLGNIEHSQPEESEFKYSKETVKQFVFPYLEELKGKYNDLSTRVVKEEQDGPYFTLTLKDKELPYPHSYHELTVDLNTGEAELAYNFPDLTNDEPLANSETNWWVASKGREEFNLEDLGINELEQREPLLKKHEPSEIDLKHDNMTQVSPALKMAPEALNESKQEENKVPSDVLMKQLMKENNGLKTFLQIVKSKHPEVYQSVYKDIKNSLQQVPKADTPKSEVKQKEKELELQL
ncbi:hypothetical protein, partial [Streptomyces sp. NPDC013433]|uniref:hypothetical protein n=1 Tax=Streptomyces sp. NPDC013433 TaxID=3155604 RepID=UPI0034562F83